MVEKLGQKLPKVGVLGGGQLGRMLALESANLGIHPYFLDKSIDFPAGQVCQTSHFVTGDFTDFDDVVNFGKSMDIVTIEIENVNTQALQSLEESGIKVYPQSEVIKTIKDKGIQKAFYDTHHIPTAPFFLADNRTEILEKLKEHNWQAPFIQKARTGGYDGKGVQLVNDLSNTEIVWDTPSVIEQAIEIEKELAVIIVRSSKGEVKTYDPVEMIFDHSANVLDYQQCPASISTDTAELLSQIAHQIAESLEIIGILAVEFFLTKDGVILVNEVAPRTHNSGHHSLDACVCSQFEQHIRAIMGLPLGDTSITSESAMINVLGDKNALQGPVHYDGLDKLLAISEAKLHLYGKELVKPKRKMGHINLLSTDLSLINKVKSTLTATNYG